MGAPKFGRQPGERGQAHSDARAFYFRQAIPRDQRLRVVTECKCMRPLYDLLQGLTLIVDQPVIPGKRRNVREAIYRSKRVGQPLDAETLRAVVREGLRNEDET